LTPLPALGTVVAIHLGTGTVNHGEIKRIRSSGVALVGPMKCIRGCAATVVWILLALFMSACSSGFDFLSPAAVSPPPQQPPVAPAQPLAARAVDTATPGGVRAEIIRWFSRAGYQSIQAEALTEHAGIESGFRPCASNGSNLRYTFQWSGARLRRLDEFAGARGSCPPLEKQLAFANNELRNEPTYSCFWRATTKPAALAALRRGFGGGRC
jgi:hypothetical protein